MLMSEKELKKLSLEDLSTAFETLKAHVKRLELQERIRERPVESAGLMLIGGFILGILIGASMARRTRD